MIRSSPKHGSFSSDMNHRCKEQKLSTMFISAPIDRHFREGKGREGTKCGMGRSGKRKTGHQTGERGGAGTSRHAQTSRTGNRRSFGRALSEPVSVRAALRVGWACPPPPAPPLHNGQNRPRPKTVTLSCQSPPPYLTPTFGTACDIRLVAIAARSDRTNTPPPSVGRPGAGVLAKPSHENYIRTRARRGRNSPRDR